MEAFPDDFNEENYSHGNPNIPFIRRCFYNSIKNAFEKKETSVKINRLDFGLNAGEAVNEVMFELFERFPEQFSGIIDAHSFGTKAYELKESPEIVPERTYTLRAPCINEPADFRGYDHFVWYAEKQA